jgi:hypothetical protein
MFSDSHHFLFLSPINLNNKKDQEIRKRKFCWNSPEGTTLEKLMRKLRICPPHETLFGYQIEENEVFGACSTNGEEKCIQGFGGETLGKVSTWKI